MCDNLRYPILEIDLKKLYQNAKEVNELLNLRKINLTGIIKGASGLPKVAKAFIDAGCEFIGSSRISHLKELKESGYDYKSFLIRIPMLSELEDVVKYADISANSEITTLVEIEKECSIQNKTHNVVLMMDVGDLREGFINEEDMLNAALYIENNFDFVHLYGVGMNVGCYGAVAPTTKNTGRLVKTAQLIESRIGRKLEMISAGSTSSIVLIDKGKDLIGVTNIRAGEAILVGRSDDYLLKGTGGNELHRDVFTLKAQVIEIKTKPSQPIGETIVDAFGNKPVFEDRGTRKRALLGVGRYDLCLPEKFIPRIEGIEILGASGDHLILDIEDCKKKIKIGDILEFDMLYPGVLYLTLNPLVTKVYKNEDYLND